MSDSKTILIEENIVAALSGDDLRISPFLPYLLQDIWEMVALIEHRARELMTAYPQHTSLFTNYLTKQKEETDLLERVHNTTMSIKKRTIL